MSSNCHGSTDYHKKNPHLILIPRPHERLKLANIAGDTNMFLCVGIYILFFVNGCYSISKYTCIETKTIDALNYIIKHD